MPVSFANIQPGNFELTPCRVTYKGVDLGATLGNVVVKIENTLADLKSDQLGTTVIDRKVSGMKITVETELAETQLMDNWKVVFPAYNLIDGGISGKAFYFASAVGTSMVDLAGELNLHPLSRPDSDLTHDFKIYLATAEGKADISQSPTDQQKIKVVWHMYPDFTTTPPRFMFYGDPSIGLISASAGAATAATGNAGDGTVSSITVFNGFTADETITLQCVTAVTNAGVFNVNGSVSGPLGLATVGVNFNSDPIAFLINDGTNDFAVADSFTIATVAANYV